MKECNFLIPANSNRTRENEGKFRLGVRRDSLFRRQWGTGPRLPHLWRQPRPAWRLDGIWAPRWSLGPLPNQATLWFSYEFSRGIEGKKKKKKDHICSSVSRNCCATTEPCTSASASRLSRGLSHTADREGYRDLMRFLLEQWTVPREEEQIIPM